jgi:hypothetical protein
MMAGRQAGAIISDRFIAVLQEGAKELKKFMLIGSLVALVVAALALPALAQDRISRDDARGDERQAERFAAFLDDYFYAEDNDRWEDNNWWEDDNWWDDNGDFDEVDPPVSQSFDQQAVSGDVNQSFNVSNTGDNSNQCANVQGVANTGNAQNQIGVLQYGSEADDFSFEDSGASINVSPNSATRCDQQVNQAASAYNSW